MKLPPEMRLAAAVVYVGLTVFLFDSVASLARPSRVEAEAPLFKEPIVVAKAAVPVRRSNAPACVRCRTDLAQRVP